MAERQTQIFKCPVCDTVVEVLESCGLELVCCGPEMIPLREKICSHDDPHAISVEKTGQKVRVRVGKGLHDMEEDHQIIWIELNANGRCYRQFLSAGQTPEAMFVVDGGNITARAYCNAHGLFRNVDSGTNLKVKHERAAVSDLIAV